jgi:hypothetical protein
VHPDDELLAAIALGEDVTADEAAHVAACADCAAVVAELRATLGLVRSSAHVELVEPPASVWAAIAAETAPAPTAQPTPPAVPPAAPPVADELAQRRERGRPRLGWLIGATAAGVALGILGVQAVTALQTPAVSVLATAPLETLDTGERGGDADLVDEPDGLALRLSVDPLDAGDGLLEVWLINTDLTRMVSVGILPNAATTGSFMVTPGLVEQGYRIVDISREPLDDRPEHSGDSVLRGTLA